MLKPRREKSENYLLGCGIKSSCSLLQQFRILFHVLTESLIESCFFLLSFLLFGRFRVRFGHSFLRSQPIGYLTFFLRWLDHRLIIVFFTITTRTKKKLRFTVASNSRRKSNQFSNRSTTKSHLECLDRLGLLLRLRPRRSRLLDLDRESLPLPRNVFRPPKRAPRAGDRPFFGLCWNCDNMPVLMLACPVNLFAC